MTQESELIRVRVVYSEGGVYFIYKDLISMLRFNKTTWNVVLYTNPLQFNGEQVHQLQELASLLGIELEVHKFKFNIREYRFVCSLEELLPLLGKVQLAKLLLAPIKEVRDLAVKNLEVNQRPQDKGSCNEQSKIGKR